METEAQHVLAYESINWLNRGRGCLLKSLLKVHRPAEFDKLDILEVGAGAGQNVQMLAEFGALDLVEKSDYFCEQLLSLSQIRFLHRASIPQLQLNHQYHVICALDVLEHIENDAEAMDWICTHLRPRGVFIATAPAYQWLFTDHDRMNHHYRRYTKSDFAKLVGSRLRVLNAGYFNSLLFPVALVSRALWQAKRQLFRATQKKQPSTVPNVLDWLFGEILEWEVLRISKGAGFQYGLSVFCVAERTI